MSELLVMAEAYKTMPTEAIEAMKATYGKDNANLAELLEAILATRKVEAEAQVRSAAFAKAIEGIASKLPQPPNGILNFYAHYGEVEVYDQAKPKEEVILQVDGKEVKEMRHPLIKVKKWIVQTNHSCHVSKSANGSISSHDSGKRALTVKQVVNDHVNLIGNFRNAAEACKHIKIEVNGDSAPRKLLANGYIMTAYTGNEFLIKQS
jgi:uncharacterized beta-barrel protein YwiB (DUF1934 family)